MIRIRRTFVAVFFFLLITTAVLTFVLPNLLPAGSSPEAYYRTIPFRLVVLLGLLLIVTWVWTYLSSRKLTVRRFARVLRQQVGQVFEERFIINNPSRFGALWVEVVDESPIPGKEGSRVLSNVIGRSERSYVTRTILTRRGAFRLGPTLLRTGDPFGLFSYTKEFTNDTTLLVLPMIFELERFPTLAGFLPGGRALRQRTPEVTPYAASVREYAPGDPLNRIHWKTTARRDQFMVKEFEQDPLADIWIFVDAHEDVNVGGDEEILELKDRDPFWIWTKKLKVNLPAETFEYAVSAAASIANYFIRAGRAVGLASAGRGLAVLQAERGERQLSKILETLAFVKSDGKLPLLGLVTAQAPHLARGSTVVLITASSQPGVEAAVDELMRRDIRPIVVLIEPSSFGGRANSNELFERIRMSGTPACKISYGDDLSAALDASVFPLGPGNRLY